MKRKYEDVVFDRIAKLNKEINTYLNHLGEGKLIEILTNRFGLTDSYAELFLEIIEKMMPAVPPDAKPQKWFFQKIKEYPFETKTRYRSRIRKERLLVIETIKKIWKMPEKLRSNAIEFWPKKWRKFIDKKAIVFRDEQGIISATEIANLILSERYILTPGCSAPGSPDTRLLFTRPVVKGPRTRLAEPAEG
jgi:hypothetical protein